MDVYVLDGNLDVIGIVDNYNSLIWANRYRAVGDCELYLGADPDMVSLLAMGRYLIREGDDMVCRIKKTEITTSTDDGDFLTVTGYDTKDLLDQRIAWGNLISDGNAEEFARSLIDGSLGGTADADRIMLKPDGTRLLYLDTAAGFTDVTTEQVSYANIGDTIRSFCSKYGWGYRVTLKTGALYLAFYRGTDRSNSVIFSPNYENLIGSDYSDDATNLGNVALIGGDGSGVNRAREYVGEASGIDRAEFFIDGRELTRNISWGTLRAQYPMVQDGGEGEIIYDDGGNAYYRMRVIDVYIYDDEHLAQLQAEYPGGTVVTIDGNRYYRMTNKSIAKFEESDHITYSTAVSMYDIIYLSYLLGAAYGKVSEHGERVKFSGDVDPNVTFRYKQDYYLGDIVTVENEYGISRAARIVEVREINDEAGYRMEPIFEYLEETTNG